MRYDNHEGALHSLIEEGDDVLFAAHGFAGHGEHLDALVLFSQLLFQSVDEDLAVDAEHHPMDGLKDDPLVVNVVELDEGVASGVIGPLRFRQGDLDLLPVGLGGGQAVVAVAHGEEEHGMIAVFLLEGLLIRQLGEILKCDFNNF